MLVVYRSNNEIFVCVPENGPLFLSTRLGPQAARKLSDFSRIEVKAPIRVQTSFTFQEA